MLVNKAKMEFLDCKICQVPYDEEEHRPRNSLCGHEICSACVRALIKDGILECPKCRQKNIITVPDDLPICFGLIDVIRAFKTQSISLKKESEPCLSGATNDEICILHKKHIGHRCLKCEMWICDEECLDVHSTLIGCSTISAPDAMNSMIVKQTENTKVLLTCFTEDVNNVTCRIDGHNNVIQEQTVERKRDSEMAEKQINDIFEEAEKQRKIIHEKTEKQIKDISEESEKQRKHILEKAEKQKRDILKKEENQEKVFLEENKKHSNDLNKLKTMLDEGIIHKNKLLESENHLKAIDSPYVLTKKIEELTQRRLLLSSFSVKSMGADCLTCLIKPMSEGKYTYVEMTINGEKIRGKLALLDGKIFVHVLLTKHVPEDSTCIAFERIQKLIPSSAPLVFLELSVGGAVKGHVILRLNKNSPYISEHMVKIVTGQLGKSLQNIELYNKFSTMNCIRTCALPFSELKINCVSRINLSAKKCDIVAHIGSGYIQHLYFQVGTFCYDSNKCLLGSIESGMDILQECYDNYRCSINISDCGIIIKQ